MEKVIAIFTLLFALGVSAFADKSRFYENGKLLDVMYIQSEDGLRVRKNPDLKSEKRITLPYRLPVKIVAIGKEATIDGINSNWVEIFIPRTFKIDTQFGWVFGGYLSKEQPVYIPPKGRKAFKDFLQSCLFEQIDGAKYIYFSEKDGKLLFNLNSGFPGTSLIIDADVTILDDRSFKIESKNNSYVTWADLSYIITISDFTATNCVFSAVEFYGSDMQLHKIEPLKMRYEVGEAVMGDFHVFDMKNALDYVSWDSNIRKYGLPCVDLDNETTKHYMELYAESFMKQYRDYWDPIVEEHQKLADAMK